MADASPPKRPFKICNSQRENKKGVVCSTLAELKTIACERYTLNDGCRVFLESDGTEVDNEDYFQFVAPQTLFMATESDGEWVRDSTMLECFGGSQNRFSNLSESQESFTDEVDAGPCANTTTTTKVLPLALRQKIVEDPVFFVSLSNLELECLVELQTRELMQQLSCSMAKAKLYQGSAQQELDRRQDIKETTELLRICKKAIHKNHGHDEDEETRKKIRH